MWLHYPAFIPLSLREQLATIKDRLFTHFGTGQESRQQLYTMLTRGRHANHLYLRVVGGGTQLETLLALWKQRLDGDIAPATEPATDCGPKSDRPHAPHFAATIMSSARTRPLKGDPAGRLRPRR